MKEMSLEESVVEGSRNCCTTDPSQIDKPLVVRGVIKKHHVDECVRINRDFYYIDTGYVGNFPSQGNASGKKIWHRVVKNENQHCVIRNVPADRWNHLISQDPRLVWKGWKHYNKKILLVLPNPKACKYYDLDYDTWVNETTEQIKKYSNLPIEVRVKGARSYRNLEYSIYDAFDSGVYATVAMNSIAALESVLYGIPAFVSVPCAASPLASTDLSQLDNPFFPDIELIQKQCYNIAYGQFTHTEILNGTAWKILQKY
jgi:hypothetical protein